MKYRDRDTSKHSSHRRRPVSSLLKILDSGFHPQGVRRGCKGLKPQQHTLRRNDKIRIICLLLACLLTPHANAARLGRIFFTPQQRLNLDHSNVRNASADGNSSSVLTVNGIVQKRGGPRTVWINGVPKKAGQSDERSPDALSVDLPGKSQRVKIKVGQKLHLDQPLPPNSQSPDN